MTWQRCQFSLVTSQNFQAVRISTHVLISGASQRSRDGLFLFGSSQGGNRPNYRWKTMAKGFFHVVGAFKHQPVSSRLSFFSLHSLRISFRVCGNGWSLKDKKLSNQFPDFSFFFFLFLCVCSAADCMKKNLESLDCCGKRRLTLLTSHNFGSGVMCVCGDGVFSLSPFV